MSHLRRLLIHCPDPTDATSMYRGMGPMNDLARHSQGFSMGSILVMGTETTYSWESLGKYEAAFIQRPYLDKHVTVMNLLRNQGIPVWVDFDDWLFGVPTDNPCYGQYMNDEVQSNIAQIIQMAEVVTVTTKHLKRLIQRKTKTGKYLNENVHVIPNGPLSHHKLNERAHDTKKTTFLWRGSSTHQRDLLAYAHDLIEFDKQHKLPFTFLGYNPWFVTDHMGDNAVVAGGVPIDDFHRTMAKFNPSFVVVPLFDCEFNRAKSSIAYVEATIAGAITIAPDFEEWRKPGVITYDPKQEGSLLQAMQAAIAMSPDMRLNVHALAKKYVWEEMAVANQRAKRTHIIKALFDGGSYPKGGAPEGDAEEEMVLE